MPTLMELYRGLFGEAGPAGRPLGQAEIDRDWPMAMPAFDRDVAPDQRETPSFRRASDGSLTVRLAGGRRFAFDVADERWFALGKGERGREPGRGRVWPDGQQGMGRDVDLRDSYSKTEAEYARVLSNAATHSLGNGWANMIDSLYGRGSTKRILHDLWVNHYTDEEGIGEVMHYYDVAQQAAQHKSRARSGQGPNPYQADPAAQLAAYPINIRPRYDYDADDPANLDGDPDGPGFTPTLPNRRVTRPAGPEHFRNPDGSRRRFPGGDPGDYH